MPTSPIPQTSRILMAALVAASVAASCGLTESGDVKVPTTDSCPSSAEDVAKAHWGLKTVSDDLIRAGLLATHYVESLSFRVEGDIEKGCKAIATSLGASAEQLKVTEKEPGAEPKLYCDVAAQQVEAAEVATQGGDLTAEPTELDCVMDVGHYEECVKECDPDYKLSAEAVDCDGRLLGVCDGSCEGGCYTSVGRCTGTCDDKCTGACDGAFKGECEGKCTGSCDGKPLKDKAKGKCEGTCEGSCTSGTGQCGGTCNGSCSGKCKVEAFGSCAGVCSGRCDGELSDRACEGSLSAEDLGEGCGTVCGIKSLVDQRCKDPSLLSRVEEAKDEEAAKRLVSTMQSNMPKLLLVAEATSEPSREYLEASKKLVQEMAEAVEADKTASKKLKACTAQAVKNHERAATGTLTALDSLASFRATAGI